MSMKLRKPILVAMLLTIAVSAANAAEIPSGSHATVRLNTSLSSATAHKEQPWSGTLTSDIVAHGKVVAKAGAPVHGRVTT
jgi:phosphate-selective porin